MKSKSSLSSALLTALVALVVAPPAVAQEFRLHLEPAVGIWVDTPQSDRFTPGLYVAVRPGLSLGRVVDLQWSYALLYTPAEEGFTETGLAHFLMAGVRVRPFALMRPPSEQLGGLFVDFNAGYVRTEDFDRFGLDFGLGYGLQLSDTFSLGLVARYGHIFQPDDTPGQDPNDGQFMTVGLDFAFGPAYVSEAERDCPACGVCAEQEICPELACADRDRDGVCDAIDRCPDAFGPSAAYGCPPDPCRGPALVVLVQFKYDSATLPAPRDDDPQTMDPVLDKVSAAIAQDPSCRVCIIGYASEEGTSDHNQALSERRAGAVQGYMRARGLATGRIPTTGHGERCQLIPERSLERNRRVEFRRLQPDDSCPTACTE